MESMSAATDTSFSFKRYEGACDMANSLPSGGRSWSLRQSGNRFAMRFLDAREQAHPRRSDVHLRLRLVGREPQARCQFLKRRYPKAEPR
jgi:hypothetical protein